MTQTNGMAPNTAYRCTSVEYRRRPQPRACSLPPAIEQPAVEPVPQKVRAHLHVTLSTIVYGDLEPRADRDVLPFAERDLHLRNNIPLRFLVIDELARTKKLHHRRPRSPETIATREALADRAAPARLFRRLVGVGW